MKILVLRFSSIGDIVLTTPVVRALARQLPGAEVHFATKPAYRGLLEANPYVARVHLLGGSLRELVQQLKAEKFDYVVDLHHNLRTLLITRQLAIKSSSFDKLNWQKWLLVNTKIDRLPRVHIVARYLAAAAPLGVHDDGQGLDYFIPADQEIDLASLPAPFAAGYVAVAIGAQHATKRLPLEKLVELCQRLAPRPVILLGGPEDAPVAQAIIAAATSSENKVLISAPDAHSLIENGCGRYSLHQSASLLRQAELVVSHDTGLMHIAAAFGRPIVSIWGNTVPEFGMYPFRTEYKVLEVAGLSCRPCSKIGFDKCPQGHFRCMREQRLPLDWQVGRE